LTLPDTDTLANVGGALVDYGSGVEDPTTDRPAAAANIGYADAVAATHTAVRAWVRIVGSATAPTVATHDSVWGNTLAVAPTLVRNGVGDITITWPASVTDELGAAHNVNIRGCQSPNVEGATLGIMNLTQVTANTARLRMLSTAGAASDFAGVTVLCAVL